MMSGHTGVTEHPASSSLGLLDAKLVDVFRTALEKILASEIAETTFSEIIDGLPTKETWLQYDIWNEDHPVNVLGHEMICDGARDKARRFRDELDIYMLSFPSNVSLSFQLDMSHENYWPNKPGTDSVQMLMLARPCMTFSG